MTQEYGEQVRAAVLRKLRGGAIALESDGSPWTDKAVSKAMASVQQACIEVVKRMDLPEPAPPVSPPAEPTPDAWVDVKKERERQKSVEGWTEAHDDAHEQGEMAKAAMCYAAPVDQRITWGRLDMVPPAWPWEDGWWKPTPKNRRRELVKAGALILAEIERLDRRSPPPDAAPPTRWNVWTCSNAKCGKMLVAIDRDEGTTPFSMMCGGENPPGCGDSMYSAFYPANPRPATIPAPTHEWYRPTADELDAECNKHKHRPTIPTAIREHVRMGGLLIRRLGADGGERAR